MTTSLKIRKFAAPLLLTLFFANAKDDAAGLDGASMRQGLLTFP
jgi:hypothetical protein